MLTLKKLQIKRELKRSKREARRVPSWIDRYYCGHNRVSNAMPTDIVIRNANKRSWGAIFRDYVNVVRDIWKPGGR